MRVVRLLSCCAALVIGGWIVTALPALASGGIGGWIGMGPDGGRVRALAVDPVDANIIWAGSPGGGIWRSGDGGGTWASIDDALPSMVVTCIVIDPLDRNTMYACTGEGFFQIPPVRGSGILKSLDGGHTWNRLPATDPAVAGDGFAYVSALAINPTDSRMLIAACGDGIHRSTDAGASWTRVYSPVTSTPIGQAMGSVQWDPNSPWKAIAGGFLGQAAFSADWGATWTERTLIAGTLYRRVEPAYAASVRNWIYASVSGSGITAPVFRSKDGGNTWTLLSSPGHVPDIDANMIWVDPMDAKHVVIGGQLQLMRSLDGGSTFTEIFPDSFLRGLRLMVALPGYDRWDPSRRSILVGHSGGVARAFDIVEATTAASDWVALNKGLEVSRFQSGAATASGRITGGNRDIGAITWFPELGRWRTFAAGSGIGAGGVRIPFTSDPDELLQGDSGAVAVDPSRPETVYHAYADLSLARSPDAGVTIDQICESLPETQCGAGPGAGVYANRLAPIALDPSSSGHRLYAGAASLWVTEDATAVSVTWRSVKPPLSGALSSNRINAIAVSPLDPQVAWVGYNDGMLAVTTNALDPSPSWATVTPGLTVRAPVTSITADVRGRNAAYATWGNGLGLYDFAYIPGNLRRTIDLGATWTDLSATLPVVPMYSVVQRPGRPQQLFVSTTQGVYTSTDDGLSWSGNIGPSNTKVPQLFWIAPGTLGAATFGRGMFRLDIP